MEKILILIDTSRQSGRQFLSGVERYISAFTEWQVHIGPPDYLPPSRSYDTWANLKTFNGIIAGDVTNTSKLLRTKAAKVFFDTRKETLPNVSNIITDSEMIGTQAAEYFLSLDFENFAYCGFRDLPWSQKRFKSYKKKLKISGVKNIFEYNDEDDDKSENKTERVKIAEWLKKLPQPLCIFACNDDRAVYILEACKVAGLNVPEEVAVLGVDNDKLVCNLSSPPLSSMELGFDKAGFQAAKHLEELIKKNTKNKTIYVRPTETINRKSTDIMAIRDKNVVEALIFIRNNFHKSIQISDVVQATYLSRRELEKRFKKSVKKTIKSEIERLRIELIKKKLLSSNETIQNIAKDIEFTDPEHFSRYFKKRTGLSPSQFRRNT